MQNNKFQFLVTQGSDFEIGQQTGEFFREQLSVSMIQFYRSFWKRFVGPSGEVIRQKKIRWIFEKLINQVFVKRLRIAQPRFIHERVRGLAEGLGLGADELFLILLFPDLFPFFQNLAAKLSPAQFVLPHLPTFGCSSFFSKGDSFLHGRNLDFPGVGYWDALPVLQLFIPNEGMRYLGITSAGVPFAGISGINEAGLVISLHQHYAKDVSLKGELPFSIAERILKKESTLKGAIEELRQSKVANPWAFLMAQREERRAVLVEKSPSRMGILEVEDSFLSHSNFFQTQPLRQLEYAATERMNWDNYFRKTRLEKLSLGEKTMPRHLSYLSESYDGFLKEEKYVNRTISQLFNIQSFLVDIDRWTLWTADGSSPVHLGRYREWDLGKLFSGNGTAETGRSESGYQFKSVNVALAKKIYVESFRACFDGNEEVSIAKGTEALGLSFCTEASVSIGILHLKRGEYLKARDLLARGKAHLEGKNLTQMPPEYFECGLFLVRTLKLLGQSNEANQIAKDLLSRGDFKDQRIKKIMASEKEVSEKTLKRILIPFSSYIPFH